MQMRSEESRQMSISATMVKELREASGAGMMDAKKALTETGGDMEAAIDWLRTKGLAKAAKKAGRTAAEGLVGVAVKGGVGVAVEVNSETDFVARNSDFQAIVRAIAEVATGCADIEALTRRAARRQDRRRGGDREDHHHRREPAPAAHGLGRGRQRRLLRAQRGRREPRQDRRAGGAQGCGQRHRQADRHARRGDEPGVAERERPRSGADRAREGDPDRAGARERQARRR